MSDLSWLNPTAHAIAVYASQPLSPAATQHSLPRGPYSLLGPDFHRLDRASFAWRTHSITSSARASSVGSHGGGLRWPRTIRIRQDASVTTTEPAIAVARDQVIDRVADHPWDEVEDPCPLPARKLARNAQHGFGFYKALAGRHERKRIWAIRIDAKLLSERTSLGQLNGHEAKIAAAITFADEAAAARA